MNWRIWQWKTFHKDSVSGSPCEQPVQSNKYKNNLITYSTVSSTVALLISFASFYYTWWMETHSLDITIAEISGPVFLPQSPPVRMEISAVLQNKGNKTETVLSMDYKAAQLSWPKNPESRAGPFVLKAGEAVAVTLFFDIENGNRPDFDLLSYSNVILTIVVVNPNKESTKRDYSPIGEIGSTKHVEFKAGRVEFYSHTDWVIFKPTSEFVLAPLI